MASHFPWVGLFSIHISLCFDFLCCFGLIPLVVQMLPCELIPFPFNGNAIMNLNTPLLFEFFDLSFVFAAPCYDKQSKTKKRKENRLLQVNEHVFTVQLNAIPFFLVRCLCECMCLCHHMLCACFCFRTHFFLQNCVFPVR